MTPEFTLRVARPEDVPAMHALISDNLEAGHLLPRSIDDLHAHASRFVVIDGPGGVVGCAELAPLGPTVAEVRSLVVHAGWRGRQLGPALVSRLADDAAARGFSTLCAFTHEPSHFVRLGFTIVPHMWVPEKIARDCTTCPLFRRCGQYAVTLTLRAGVTLQPAPAAAVIHGGRHAPGPRASVQRLHRRREADRVRREPVPA